MERLGSKSKITVALFLAVIISATLIALPTANAQAKRETYAVISLCPNPVGVNQEVLITFGITQQLTMALMGWEGLTVTITRPDGKTETLGPYKTDSTGLTGVSYTPTMVGNYTVQAHFPEQALTENKTSPGIPVGTIMMASDSKIATLVVQQEPIQYYPEFPLPTEYWTRPIDQQLREWSPVAGNWLTTPRNFYAVGNEYAPESAHILWTKPLTSGGLVGGALNAYSASEQDITNVGYETGDAYEGKWSGSIVMSGKLYYQKYASGDAYKEIVCVDLHTGEQLWSKVLLNNLTLTRGQLLFWQTFNLQGVYDYLWATAGTTTLSLLGLNATAGTTWCAFDPFTGDFVYAMYGIPSGTFDYGPKGEMLIYTINLSGGWMTLWNSSNIVALTRGSTPYYQASWRPMGKIVNATGPCPVDRSTNPLGLEGYMWNKTIPKGLPGSVRAVFALDRVIGALINTTHVISWGLSLKPGQEGTLLFNEVWNAPTSWFAGNQTVSWGAVSIIDKVFTVMTKESRLHYGFSTETGKFLWVISEPLGDLDYLMGGPSGERGTIAYGKLICGTMSGIIKAYDVKTGELAWKYEVYDPHMQVLWSTNFPVGHLIIAGRKLYVANLEHSANQPLPRGGPFVCLDIDTGQVIWRADGLFRQTVWGGRAVIGDSIIATMDTYDQRVYAIGRGPSATTVSVLPKVVQNGQPVVIEGYVTDVSPGTKDSAIMLRFPNGVPAVADESMSDWMLYVYKQFPRPSDVKGVWVTFDAISPEGKWIHVGGTHTDSSGMYSIPWTPPSEGLWTIVITFPGSKSYYASYAQTTLFVTAAPPTPEMPEIQIPTPPDYTPILTALTILVVIAILIGVYSIYDHRKLRK